VGPVVAFFAHPDDETFCAAGVLAAAAERGVPVTVISATRGEAGESSIPGLDDPEALGAVREQELREAMSSLGVHDVRFLDFVDSGLGNNDEMSPKAFARAALEECVFDLVPMIRELRPEVVLTFGPDGMYGHPDHIHSYRVGVASVIAAGDPTYAAGLDAPAWKTRTLYFATVPREMMLEVLARPNSPLEFVSPEARTNLGTPSSEITDVVDITPWAPAKRAAIAAHRTQTGEGGPLAGIPPEVRASQLAREYFVRFPLPWSAPVESPDIIASLSLGTPSESSAQD
jgi:N-acetyl-1-D-myo-inositol-2-amino-2-deoxy-alpha-D-glucopyranoside deacetylase